MHVTQGLAVNGVEAPTAAEQEVPDFYIGAHSAVMGHTPLTRDPRRYRSYFPKLRIVAP